MATIKSTIFLFNAILFFLISLQITNACKLNSTYKHHKNYFEPTLQRTIVVDARGAGDFLSVQEAVDSIPDQNSVYVIITFQGAGRDATVIQWHDRASDKGPNGQQLRTYNTASVTVFASHFTARNISFKNTAPAPMPGMEGWQAAAFRISGDKAYFFGCGFYGAQDTLCDDAGRHYFKDCYIEGSIDFIFGNGRSMYKGCELHSIAERFGSIAAQARNSPCEQSGFAFVNCNVTGTGKLYVGRAMGQCSRIVFAYTHFADVVAEGGWDDWDHNSNRNTTAYFGSYRCWGPGAKAVHGVTWARELDYPTARPFLAKSFVNGRHWLPSDA